ncbi:MAG: hypothetical protein KF841_04655 [Phycisphaerae bacterium]|nr:hypothetical protein [Phycisphaerae bacterium]
MPAKFGVFLVVLFFVLFPDPRLFIRQIERVRNLEQMVTPDAPELMPLEAAVRATLYERHEYESALKNDKSTGQTPRTFSQKSVLAAFDGKIPADFSNDVVQNSTARPVRFLHDLSAFAPRVVQQVVENLVYREVRYQWDWEVWGVADYMPTVAEMFEQARKAPDGVLREDCDGRAVMAASLMRRLGYKSELVTDLKHVWVMTPQGEFMGPGGRKAVRSTPEGNRTDLGTALLNIPIAMSFGVMVFPLSRELILVATALLLLLHRRMSWRAAAIGGLLLFQGLFFMRFRYIIPSESAEAESSLPSWIGFGHILGGLIFLLRASCIARRRATAAQ